MNKNEALKLLLEYLTSVQNDFVIHPDFIEDMKILLKKELKGVEVKFFQQMVTQLENINHFRKKVHTVANNEILSGIGRDSNGQPWELYSIHLTLGGNFNVRFIIKFDESTTPYLLYAFYERKGKKKTDYTIPVKISQKRYLELKD